MHVVWINEGAQGKGGAERYVRDTAAHLRALGVRSTLIYDVGSRVDPDYVLPFEGAYPRVDLPRQLRELAPDVVYVHRLAEEAAVAELAAAGVPVLRFFHDHKLFCLREHKYTAVGQETCTRTVGLRCYPCLGFVRRGEGALPVELHSVASLQRAQRQNQALTAYAVGSRYMGEHVAAHGFDRARLHVLPLYTEPPATGIEAGAPAERDPRLVLFVGQLVRGKGVDLLLRALARTKSDARLLLVGDGRQGDELRALSASLGLEPRVTFAGRIDPAELPGLYARARCLALPSRSPETFGLAGLEALAHGLPVIAADVGGIREWLEDGKNGIAVPSGDVGALAGAIDRLVGDGALAAAMGRRGIETHRERFLPEHHVRALHALLLRLAAREAA